MPNPWIEHVKKYAKDNNISYGCAITEAKGSYVKKSSAKKSPVELKPREKEIHTIQEDDLEQNHSSASKLSKLSPTFFTSKLKSKEIGSINIKSNKQSGILSFTKIPMCDE